MPPARRDAGVAEQFCCSGCHAAYHVICQLGLADYYRLEAESDASAQPARVSGSSYAELDDPTFERLYAKALPSGQLQAVFYVEGVHCAACVWLLERAVSVVPGVADVRVDVGRSRIRVVWDPTRVRPSAIARFFDSVGYAVHPYRDQERDLHARREDRALLVRVAVTGAVAGNAMLIAFALYGGAFDGIEPEYAALFRWASLIVTVPAVLFGGSVFFRSAWSGIRMRTLHMDLPISIGIIAGFVGGAINTVRGSGEVYFDSVTALIFLLLVGRYLQRAQQRRAAESTDLLSLLAPRRARRIGVRGEVEEVLVDALAPGDSVVVLPGDLVPADGVITSGRSALDLSLLTGESDAVGVAPGDPIHAGTTNLSSRLVVAVERVGRETRVGKLVEKVDECASSRPRIVRIADRWAAAFVGVVVVLAGVTALLWSWLDSTNALDHTLALLVVSCPCALGLATPLAVSAAMGRAARRGLLIKNGDVFEDLSRPGTIYLDKTGTVTEGRMSVVKWYEDESEGTNEGAKPIVLGLERDCTHPIARAFQREFAQVHARDVTPVTQHAGGGMTGFADGLPVAVGSPAFERSRGTSIDGVWATRLDEVLAEGLTPVVVTRGGVVAAVAGLGDSLRPEASALVQRLRSRGWRVALLSGDDPETVDRMGERLGIGAADRFGGRSPEDKLSLIVEARAKGSVVMVGDGINDAAALAAATVGVGLRGGAEAALAASDVFVSRGGIEGLAHLIDGSSATVRVIRRNIVFSILYNAVGASLAVAGLIHPLLAAVLMPLSSLTVVMSSYRTRAFVAADLDRPGTAAVPSESLQLNRWSPIGGRV